MTLGELKEKLEPIKDNKGYVSFEFGNANPTEFDSYRGYYDELALGFSGDHGTSMDISTFYTMVCDAIGKEFIGWKGGEFIMTESTPIWISCTGNSSDTKLNDIKIETGEFEGALTWVTLETINEDN